MKLSEHLLNFYEKSFEKNVEKSWEKWGFEMRRFRSQYAKNGTKVKLTSLLSKCKAKTSQVWKYNRAPLNWLIDVIIIN